MPNGKDRWRSTGAKTKREAMAVVHNGIEKKVQGPAIDLQQFTVRALDFVKGNHAAKTLIVYHSALEAFIAVTGNKALAHVTRSDVDRFKVARTADLAPVSVNIQLRTLRAAFNFAVRWEMILVNPFARVQQIRIPEQPPAYLTFEQFNTLCTLMDDHWVRDIVIFAVSTGMRRSELLNLEWRHVDLHRRIVQVTSTSTFKTKAGKQRTIPLNESALHVLSGRPQGHQYVFTYIDRPIEMHSLTHAFKRFARLAELPEAIHFHSLRHTFASWLVQDGVSIFQVGKLLGHSNTKTTEIYAHLQPETMHDVVDRIKF
jgi:site-specific recombinase XerD